MSITTKSWVRSDKWTLAAPAYNSTQDRITALIVFNDKLYGGAGIVNEDYLFEWNGVDAWVVKTGSAGGARIFSLAVYNGKLYAASQHNILSGKLLEWDGVSAWVLRASGNGIQQIAVFNNKLYGGGTLAGSASKIYVWNDVNAWVEATSVADIVVAASINSMVSFNGMLYWTYGGALFQWNGVDANIKVAPSVGVTMNNLTVYNGNLYGSSGVGLFMWNGVAWLKVAELPNTIGALSSYHEKLYIGIGSGSSSFSDGQLYEWDGTGLLQIAPSIYPDKIVSLYALATYHDKLYGGGGIATPSDAILLEWFSTSITTTTIGESSAGTTDTSLDGTRVRTIRHTSDLTPWIV